MCYAIIRAKFSGNDPKQTLDVETEADLFAAVSRMRETPGVVGYRVYRLDEAHERVPTWTQVE
ncbi:MAG: hypothetical protein DDT39_00030 [Firmicutes bacterium]|nr:hypothetical protein [candidate division NPL-UPA2 bacterium]